MFGPLGGPELMLILVLALIVFGPRKLPEIGKSLGKMMVEFRRASTDFKRTIEEEVEAEKLKTDLALPRLDVPIEDESRLVEPQLEAPRPFDDQPVSEAATPPPAEVAPQPAGAATEPAPGGATAEPEAAPVEPTPTGHGR